mmetsp:Transcript_70699/g.63502  ORF Transcript_70699/g.63502 Transcript_70699/m.63502 type:complete len:147 (-) Transcript_70699:18-458(-)
MKRVVSITAISAAVGTALYLTCPKEEEFQEYFEEWYTQNLWPVLKKLNGEHQDAPNENDNKSVIIGWIKTTASKAANTVEKNLLFDVLFPEKVTFEMYHLCRIAKIKLFCDEFPNGIELIFIGAGKHWFLNPAQGVVLLTLQKIKK